MGEKRCYPDTLSFNNLIEQLCENGLLGKAEEVYNSMSEKSVNPDEFTFVVLMDTCLEEDRPDDAASYFKTMVEAKLRPNLGVYNRLMDGLVKVGKVDEAKAFFDMMVPKLRMDDDSYKFIMKALFDIKKHDEVLEIIGKMLREEPLDFSDELQEFVREELRKGEREEELVKLMADVEREKAEAAAKAAEEAERAKASTRAAVSSLLPSRLFGDKVDEENVEENDADGEVKVEDDDASGTVDRVSGSRSPSLLLSEKRTEKISDQSSKSSEQKKARVFSRKDIKWSEQGLSLLSCGYDCSTRLIDVEKGLETCVFKEDQDRTRYAVNQYLRGLGPILDLEFTNDTRQFISSSDESKSNISENSIIVLDVSRQVPLSNQIYVEAYTCPCVRHHPYDQYFVAQSNGNYIAIFSSKSPFRLDKYKRYESHGVSGFPVKCNFSPDGRKLASGSSDGYIYFYNAKTCDLIKKIEVYEQTCVDVAFHPVMSNIIATCSWNGEISVFE
ncbi:WD repeat-containing protein 25 isoform X1 [Tanacetum coccineum]